MKKICLLLGVAVMCGCGGSRNRYPIASVDTDVPRTGAAPASTGAADAAVEPEPAKSEEPAPPVDSSPGSDSAPSSTLSEAQRITAANSTLEDVLFAYDRFEVSPEASGALRRDAEVLRGILRDFPQVRVTVEGHCDERGSAEYNLGLGDRRATRTIAALSQLGLSPGSFAPVSYGKEAPVCVASNESCWSRNRRAHFEIRVNATM